MMRTIQWIIFTAFCAILLQTFLTANSAPEADKIIKLPGQPSASFRQYSGYITIDEKQQRALFYYFIEAETEPTSKPLVLWLTGGPGCSSLAGGAFILHGPFRPRGDILVKNEYSWNKEANMLYLESPAGVGFSYSVNKSFYNSVNDEITARDNLAFLEGWLTKFPEYNNRDFFITGESYAGHYVPQLAELILQSRMKFNLKGVAIGNPLLEFNTDLNSKADYLWSHGLISDSTYESLTSVCNYSQIFRQSTSGSPTPVCSQVEKQVSQEVSAFISFSDVNLDICLSQMLNKKMNHGPTQEETEKLDVCVRNVTSKYLNRKDVQEALHAQLVGVTSWISCSNNRVIKYEMQDAQVPTINVLGNLAKSGVRVMIFSGDQDAVIPLLGTRTLINGLAKEMGLNTTVPYRAWFEGRQVAGWTQVYGDIISFATLRGGGHSPSFQQPGRSLVMFRGFLAGKPLPEA